jgi:hypothetical protein
VFVIPADPTATPIACQGVASAGYTTQGTVTAAPPNLYAGQAVCQFSVTSGFAPVGSYLGSETINIANPAPGGTVQLTAYLCGDPSCATGTLNPYGPPAPPTLVTINNGGTVTYPTVGGTAPYYNNIAPAPPNYSATANRCFHAAGTDDPCDPHPQHHGNGDNDGDGS